MKPLPKKCDFLEMEERWQRRWEEMGIYRFDWNDHSRPVFTIDTPPPYPSGDFHMGNALNHTYFDILAPKSKQKNTTTSKKPMCPHKNSSNSATNS